MTVEHTRELKLLVSNISRWVGSNSFSELTAESMFSGEVHHVVSSEGLMDYIHEETGISKEELGKWVDEGSIKE